MLVIITGASGVGKSSLVPILKKLLPPSFLIYDFDELGTPYDGTEIWKDHHLEQMFATIYQNHSKNIHTIVCGLIRPQWVNIKRLSSSGIDLHYILLNMSKSQRKIRLERRKAPISLIEDEEEIDLLHFWMEKYESNYIVIDTSDITTLQVASEVITLISQI